MHTVRGSFQDGVAKPEEPIFGREGQRVLITFLESEELDASSTLEGVTTEIDALGPSQDSYTPPTQSLAELLADAPNEPSIDIEAWNRQWAAIEAALKARDRADDRAEGRG